MQPSLSTTSPYDRYVSAAGTFLNQLHFPSCKQPEDATLHMRATAVYIVRTLIEHSFITGGFGVELDEQDIQNRINKEIKAFVEFQKFGKRRQDQVVKGAAQNLNQYCKIGKYREQIITQYAQFLGYRLTWKGKNITNITPLPHTT